MKGSLINRLSQGELLELWALTQGEQNNHLKEELYQLTLDDNRRVAVNALWVFTHFALADNVWLFADPKSPYAIRAQCIKLAYEQMKYWSELLDELRQTLEMISCEPLSPRLRSAWKQVMKKILSCKVY